MSLHDFETAKRAILDRVDILSVASERVKLQRKGRRWVGLCPFHVEKTPSFSITPDMGFFKCFGCGKGGDVFTFVEEMERVSFKEAFDMLADRAGVERPMRRTRGDGAGFGGAAPSDGGVSSGGHVSRADMAKANEWALTFFRENLTDGAIGRSATAYLCERGFSDRVISQFEMGLATADSRVMFSAAKAAGFGQDVLIASDLVRRGESGDVYPTFRNRLMFPIRDVTSRVVGFGGRTLVEDRAKYLNTRQTALFDKGRGLFGLNLARGPITEKRRAVVVEGYTDCVAAHQAGFGETVASLGTALTEHQIDLLRRYADTLILLFDSDQAGEAAADRAIRVALPRCMNVKLARIPDGKDPSEFLEHHDAAAFEQVLNGAIDALEFKWRQTGDRFRTGESDANRRAAVLDFMEIVADATQSDAVDVIQRGLMINQVAHLLQMERVGVDRLLVGLQRRGARRFESRGGTSHGRADRGRPGTNVEGSTEGSPGRKKDVAEYPIPQDQEQASWVHLLEVVLNEPGLLGTVDALPDVNRIVDPRDRRIAQAVWGIFGEFGAFKMADLLVRCPDREETLRVAALASRGLDRGNYEPTFRVALERISRLSRTLKLDERARALYGSDRMGLDGLQEADESLIRDGLRRHSHFAPRRHLRQALSAKGAVEADADVPDTGVPEPAASEPAALDTAALGTVVSGTVAHEPDAPETSLE